jgi:hypothetical protein
MRADAEVRRYTIDGWERNCNKCGEWWPETPEYFYRGRAFYFLSACKVCEREKKLAQYHARMNGRTMPKVHGGRADWPAAPLLSEFWK